VNPAAVSLVREQIGHGSLWLRVTGRSMQPGLADGARVRVERARASAVRAGDVVVYEAGDRLVCHRVLWRGRRSRWLVGGDARSGLVAWIDASAVLGRVVAIRNSDRRRSGTPRAPVSSRARAGMRLARLALDAAFDVARLVAGAVPRRGQR
jgi:signal peptidase I